MVTSLSEYCKYERIARSELASLVKTGKLSYANSHIVYIFKSRSKKIEGEGTLTIADLACSEKIRKSVYLGEQLLETAEKTSSLVYFSKCINYLLEGKRSQISRTEDRIVDLLYETLGGNCMTCYVVAISLAEEDKDLTFNTLAFAQKVSTIENMKSSKPRPSILFSQADSNRMPFESTDKQQNSKTEITSSRPSWIEKCTYILNENGSELKKLQHRNQELESQVISLEKMLHMSQIDQSVLSQDSPNKNTSFFSVDNDFCFNGGQADLKCTERDLKVTFTKNKDCQLLQGLPDSDLHSVCVPAEQWSREKSMLEQIILEEKNKNSELEKKLESEKLRESSEKIERESNREVKERDFKQLQAKCQNYEESIDHMVRQFETKIKSLNKENLSLQEICSKNKQTESHLKDQIITLQNARFQLQSELQQLSTIAKISAQNDKISDSMAKENKKLAQKVLSLSTQLQASESQVASLSTENSNLAAAYKRSLYALSNMEQEIVILTKNQAENQARSPLRSIRPSNTSKSIAQLRAELRSARQSQSSISRFDNKENDQSVAFSDTSKSMSLTIEEEDIKYLSMPIGFHISTDTKPDILERSRLLQDSGKQASSSPRKLLSQLNHISVFTPQKARDYDMQNRGCPEEGFASTYQMNYRSVSIAKATEKKRELNGLLDVLSACQAAFESKITANEFTESDFNSCHLRADIIKLWSEMEECLKVDCVQRETIDQISFIHDLLLKLYALFEKAVASRNSIAVKYTSECAKNVQLSRTLVCFSKFVQSLNLDDDLLLLKKEKFVRERISVSMIGRYYKAYKRKFEIRKLRRAHKTNHQKFQAGSGKFLLQTLMNSTENYFLRLFDKLRPEDQANVDRKTRQLAALAELNSICAQ